MSYRLTVVFGGKTIERREVDQQRFVVGRSTDADLVIDNLGVSRAHSDITMENETPVLRDLKSNNGTFVNGRRITRHNLNDGDEISIGKFTIQFQRDEGGDDDIPEEEAKAGGGEFTLAIDSSVMQQRQRERSSKLKAYLQYMEGKQKKNFVIDRPVVTVGKSPTCDVFVGGWRTARKHCIVFREETSFRIVDTSQKGRTFLNGTSVDDERLKDGDEIKVGSCVVTFLVGVPQMQ
ncbi:FHA domain-containing protein [Planctomycetota bacterium]